jgi:hypothetical protein
MKINWNFFPPTHTADLIKSHKIPYKRMSTNYTQIYDHRHENFHFHSLSHLIHIFHQTAAAAALTTISRWIVANANRTNACVCFSDWMGSGTNNFNMVGDHIFHFSWSCNEEKENENMLLSEVFVVNFLCFNFCVC